MCGCGVGCMCVGRCNINGLWMLECMWVWTSIHMYVTVGARECVCGGLWRVGGVGECVCVVVRRNV